VAEETPTRTPAPGERPTRTPVMEETPTQTPAPGELPMRTPATEEPPTPAPGETPMPTPAARAAAWRVLGLGPTLWAAAGVLLPPASPPSLLLITC